MSLVPSAPPEVRQRTAFDCAPAALLSVLRAQGLDVSYEAVREATATGPTGTSLARLAATARTLGADCTEVLTVPEHLLTPYVAVPAIVIIVRGAPHAVVVWRIASDRATVMDPRIGVFDVPSRTVHRLLLLHRTHVDRDAWWDHASSLAYLGPLAGRVAALGVPTDHWDHVLGTALASERWEVLARVDAATRWFERRAKSDATAGWHELVAGGHIARRYWRAFPTDDARRVEAEGTPVLLFGESTSEV